ncbi:hypothetical protein BH10BDE1_BH10BDE1_08670 [soil metagenome]
MNLTLALVAAAIAATKASGAATTSWKNEQPIRLKADAMTSASFGPTPLGDYVSIVFDFATFEAARLDLESRISLPLRNRGEAHVTVISPPEFKILAKVLSPKEIRSTVEKEIDLKKGDASPVCIGEGVAADDRTWFVVIEMPSLKKARRQVAALFVKKGGVAADFRSEEVYPHVTLGFTKRDLHLQDGVVKAVTSCKYPIHR